MNQISMLSLSAGLALLPGILPPNASAQEVHYTTIEPSATLIAPVPGGSTGSAVAVDDLNGDGILDYVVGSPFEKTDVSNGGRVYVYFGPLEPGEVDLGAADGITSGEAGSLYAGQQVATLPDMNGDGLPEIVVSTSLESEEDSGIVYILHSPHTGLRTVSSSPHNTVQCERSLNAYFATPIKSLGDLNQDGHEDFLFGAGIVGGIGSENYVVFGPISGDLALPRDASLTFEGHIMSTLSPAGDVNGDGIPDLLLGNPNEGLTDRGGAYLFYGPFESDRYVANDADARIVHQNGRIQCYPRYGCVAYGDLVGRYAQGVGDVNGDGFGDILVSAEGEAAVSPDTGFEERGVGAAYLFFGPLDGVRRLESADLEFNGEGGGFGAFPVMVDFNGDGIKDLILMAPNRAATFGEESALYGFAGPLLRGSYSPLDAQMALESTKDLGSIRSPMLLPDQDGDGLQEILLAAPSAGGLGAYQSSFYGQVHILESSSWR